MPDIIPYHGYSILSNDPRATTLNFCRAVSGGTFPAFSRVRKFGSARKRRSLDVPFEVPASLVCALVSCAGLSLSFSDEVCGGACAEVLPAAGVCCAADQREKRLINTKAANGRLANIFDKYFPQKKKLTTTLKALSQFYQSGSRALP